MSELIMYENMIQSQEVKQEGCFILSYFQLWYDTHKQQQNK